MKKGAIITIVIVLILIILAGMGVFAYYFINEVNARNAFVNVINNLTEENMNDEVVSEGNYGVVEKMLKEDFKTYIESQNKLKENYKKIEELKPLSIDVLKNDGPEFSNTKSSINAVKEENLNLQNTLKDIVSEESVNNKITENNLDEKFAELYKSVQSEMKIKDGVDSIVSSDEKFATFLDAITKVLDYLTEKKDIWFIEDDTLKSTDKTFIEEYNNLVSNTNVEF